MKKITFCFTMLFMAVIGSFGQVQIGDGTFIDKGVPIEPSRNYSYSQSIYLASEILATGPITSLQWYYAGNYNLEGSQGLTIYIGHTTKTSFSSTSNWEPIASLTQVYSGGIPANGPGWISFNFTTPFTYNGTDNLMIAVKETSDLTDYGEDDFYAYEVVDNRSLTYASYSVAPNPANPANGNLRKFLPIITLDGLNQACPKPTALMASDPTTTGISLFWNSEAANPSGGTQYYISLTNVAPTTATVPTGNVAFGETAIVSTGLLPATKYYVWVRDVCVGGPGTWSNGTSFITACLPATLVSENFNSSTNATLPACWSKIIYQPQGNATPSSVGVTSEDGYTGKSIEFYRAGDATSDLILVSPPISNLGDGTHRLRFFAKNGSSSPMGGFKIGTLDGTASESTFTEISSIDATINFVEYTIEFEDSTTEDLYIGIKLNASNENYLGYVDNIRWEVAPVCPDVTAITVPATTITTATVSWTSDGLSEWDVVYGTSETADPNTLTPVISALANPTASISGLTASTNYYVWVRSKCLAGTGFWVGPVLFRTPCLPVNNFNENFNASTEGNLPNCWTKILRGETLSSYASVRIAIPGMDSADKALELYTGFSAPTATDDIIAVSPNLGNLAAGTHRLKFFARGNGTIQIGTLANNTPSAGFSYLDDVTVTDVMSEYVIDFATYTDNNSYIGLRLSSMQSSVSVYIDDIVWEISPSCPDVTDISFTNTTSSSTSVGWTASGASQWQIVYGAPTVSDPNTLTPLSTLTSPSVDLTNLSSNTTYKVWIRSVCDEADGNGSWSYPQLVTTACNPVTTFSETFESAIDPNLPSCWSSIVLPNSGNVGLITWQPYAGSKGVEITSTATSLVTPPTLVSPPLSNLGAGTNRLRFFASSDAADVEVGTINSELGTFTPIQVVELTSTYQEYIVNFASYTGTDTNIGLRISTTEAYVAIAMDNIVWEVAPACANVNNIEVSEIATTTAQVEWSAGASEIGWQYVYAESSVSDPATLTPSTTLNDETAQLTLLTPGISYNVWIRSVCNSSAFGSWVGPVTFITNCAAANLPYIEDFETVTVPNLPNCSAIVGVQGGVNWETTNSPGNGFTTKTLSYGPDEINPGNSWFFTRGLNLIAGENYTISYKYGNNSAGLHESLLVKYGTAESVAGMTLDIANHDDVTGATPQISSVTFSPPTTGVYYFGFKAASPANQWKLYLDDIKVETSLSNGDFDNSNFTYYPNPVKDVLHLSFNQDLETVSIYNVLGQIVIEKTFHANSANMDMSGLSSGSYIVKITSGNHTKIIKIIKE